MAIGRLRNGTLAPAHDLRYAGKPAAGGCPLKIALIGSRGIPARYSGFETFCEQLVITGDAPVRG